MILVQKRPFIQVFFFSNKGQENVFYDIVEPKNAFLAYKNKNSKKSEKWHFSKGVNPWLWSKNGHFFNLFFTGKIAQDNVFYYIVERKSASLGYKNNKFKHSKNWHFPKGVNPWFWAKNGSFCTLFF